jgi:hypothetical protein
MPMCTSLKDSDVRGTLGWPRRQHYSERSDLKSNEGSDQYAAVLALTMVHRKYMIRNHTRSIRSLLAPLHLPTGTLIKTSSSVDQYLWGEQMSAVLQPKR